ncbi:hypothetical protein BKA64DRAFT_655407 [Cadophora sp. MPI-SDFR-AT-0126]|nr:hypothetical protein BKA64DRAFT_655407 [Leotiomycetes sp. MPI-SDFR-AT-0126]
MSRSTKTETKRPWRETDIASEGEGPAWQHSSPQAMQESDDEFGGFPALSQSDMEYLDRSVDEPQGGDGSYTIKVTPGTSVKCNTLDASQKSQLHRKDTSTANPLYTSAEESRLSLTPQRLSAPQCSPKILPEKGHLSSPAPGIEAPRKKRRFFEEKDEDLLHAALYESRLLATQEKQKASVRERKGRQCL